MLTRDGVVYLETGVMDSPAFRLLRARQQMCLIRLCIASAQHYLRGRFVGLRVNRELGIYAEGFTVRTVNTLARRGFVAWEADDLVVLRYAWRLEAGRELHRLRQHARRASPPLARVVKRIAEIEAELCRPRSDRSDFAPNLPTNFTPNFPRQIEFSRTLTDNRGANRGANRSGSVGGPPPPPVAENSPPPPPSAPDARARAFGSREGGGGGWEADAGDLGAEAAAQLEEFASMWKAQKRGFTRQEEARWWKYSAGMLGLALPLETDVFAELVRIVRAEVFDAREASKVPRLTVVLGEPSDSHRTPEASKVPALLRTALANAHAARAKREAAAAKRARPEPAPVVGVEFLVGWWADNRPREPYPGPEAALLAMDATKSRPRAAPLAFAGREGVSPVTSVGGTQNGPQNAANAVLEHVGHRRRTS